MTDEARPTRKLVFALIIGSLSSLAPLSIDMYLPAFPKLTEDLHATASSIQLTLTACLLGLAVGQLLAGPISDSRGRKKPLLIGLTAYVLASVCCLFAPDDRSLTALRFVQGFAGAAGLVISRAIARDLYRGDALARFFAMLMLVNGTAPILAPVVGGQVLRFTSWRGVFGVLAVLGTMLAIACAWRLPETLPVDRRHSGGLKTNLRVFKRLLTDLSFMGFALSGGLGYAVMFVYIAGSSFVLQEIYNLSPQGFSACFAANAIGIVLCGQIGARLIKRFGSNRLLTTGLIGMTSGATAFLVAVVTDAGLVAVLPALFVAVGSIGLVGPNASALALNDHGKVAGSASALLGLLQFTFGAVLAPLAGIAGTDTAVPMAVTMTSIGVTALVVRALSSRWARRGAVDAEDVEMVGQASPA